jgi:Helicase associated domain./AP2 domain.
MERINFDTKENTVGFPTDVKRHRTESPMQRIHYEFCIIVRPGPLGLCLQPDPPRGIKVVKVYQESPYKNLIQKGDRILSVNFYSVEIATLHDLTLLLEADGSKTLLVERCLERPVTIAMANANMIPYPYTFNAKPDVTSSPFSLYENDEILPIEDDYIIAPTDNHGLSQNEQQQQQLRDSSHTKTINSCNLNSQNSIKVKDLPFESSSEREPLAKQPIIATASESSQKAKVKRKSSKSSKNSSLSATDRFDDFKELTLATSIATVKRKKKAVTSSTLAAKSSSSNHHLRGVTMRPSGKWQAQFYFAGKSQYIGVFDSREKAALAYEIAREHLKNRKARDPSEVDARISAARKAAFDGVNEIWGTDSGEKTNRHRQEVNGMGVEEDDNSNKEDSSDSGQENGHAHNTRMVGVSNGIKNGAKGTEKLVSKNEKPSAKKKRSYEMSFPQSQDGGDKTKLVRMTKTEDVVDDIHKISRSRGNDKEDKHHHLIERNNNDDNDDKSASTLNSSSTHNDERKSHPKSTSSHHMSPSIPENDSVGTNSTQDDDTPEPQQPPRTPTKMYSNTNVNGSNPILTSFHCESFDDRLEELKTFVQKHGHCDIHRDSKLNQSLGTWCELTRDTYHRQRTQGEKLMKKRKLSQKQIESLEEIGFQWTLSPSKSHSQPSKSTRNGLTSSPYSAPHPNNMYQDGEEEEEKIESEEKENNEHQLHQQTDQQSQESSLGKHAMSLPIGRSIQL